MDFALPSPEDPENVLRKSIRRLSPANPNRAKDRALNLSNRNTNRFSRQALFALIAMGALEVVFAGMAHLGDLSIHITAFMAFALGAGVLYFVGLFSLQLSGSFY
jgi:hypothetical protein